MSKQPLALVLAFMGFCFFSVAATGADTSKPAEGSAKPANHSGKSPFIVHNPDGTFTVQKVPASGKSKNAMQKGLVIPPQVVVPMARLPEKDPSNPPR